MDQMDFRGVFDDGVRREDRSRIPWLAVVIAASAVSWVIVGSLLWTLL